MKNKTWLIDFVKGLSLGSGILPGVSVGTVGIIVKVYDKLIGAINGLKNNFFKAFKTLLPIALGCILSAVILLLLQDTLYSIIPFELTCVFAGFVLVGVPVVWYEIINHKFNYKDYIRIIVGFIIAAGIGILSVIAKVYWKIDMSDAFNNPSSNWWIYPLTLIIGFIAAVGCLLPGISGAMVLFIFGLYQPIIDLYKGDNSIIHNTDRLTSGLLLTVMLLIGILLGLLLTSSVMEKLLKKHKIGTYTSIIGFILGSFVSMFINQDVWGIYPTLKIYHIFIGCTLLLASYFVFYFLFKKSLKIKE